MPTTDRDNQQRTLLSAIADAEAADARLFAHRMRLRAELDRTCSVDTEAGPEQFGVLELAGTARIGQIRAGSQFSDARRLTELFPTTLELLQTGVMFRETAVLLLQLTINCADEVQTAVEQQVLTQITTANTADVRTLVNSTITEVEADLDPTLTQERLARAKRDRRVWVQPMRDGMNHIGAALDNAQTRRWVLDFDELVRAQKIADRLEGTIRTTDQRRADLFATLPSQLLALIQAIQHGDIGQLLTLAQQDPELADTLPSTETEPTSEDDQVLTAAQWFTQHPPPRDPPPHHRSPQEPPQDEASVERLTVEQLTVGLLRLPVRNPMVLNIHIPMSTVLDLDHRAAFIEGIGPVPAEQARLLVPVAGLRRLYVHPDSGVPIGIDPVVHPALCDEQGELGGQVGVTAEQVRTRLLNMLGPATMTDRAEDHHDPSAGLRRFVEVRDQHCLGIGCSQPAHRSQQDHELPYPEGPTAGWNLSSKSARCHRAKHAGWTVTRTDEGTAGWTSPLGHIYSRPGVWQAPPPLPADLTLPEPRLSTQTDQGPTAGSDDRPLWIEPAPLPEVPTIPTRSWDDEPPL